MKIHRDIAYRHEIPQCLLDLYLPENPDGVLLFFHGGGLEGGSRTDQDAPFQQLAEHGIAVASADYRMYPSARFPDFVEDAAAAAGWLWEHADQYGLENVPLGWFMGGSSAGCYLSMMLCFDRKYLAAEGLEPERFQGFFLDAGQPTAHFRVLAERGKDTRAIVVDETAPLFFIGEPHPDSPRLLAITADQDMPARYEQNLLLMAALRQFGWPENKLLFRLVKGYQHCGYTNVKRPDGSYPYAELIEEFIRQPESLREEF